MQTIKKSGAFVYEDSMETPGICSSPYCSINRVRLCQSISEVHEDILNVSPRLSHHNPNICLDRRLYDRHSLSIPEKASWYSCSNNMPSTEIPIAKSAAELITEIATIEVEVVHLERYLLSLYRTVFDQYLAASPTTITHISRSSLECQTRSLVQDPARILTEHQSCREVNSDHINDQMNQSQVLERTEMKRHINWRHSEYFSVHDPAAGSDSSFDPSTRVPKHDELKSLSGHRSLADHMGASIADHVPETPCKLSEDIIRCISSIYCKLATSPTQQMDLLSSPTPSATSSSTFSPRDPCDSWSPRCHYEAVTSPFTFDSPKDKHSPYSSNGMVEIPKISIDGNRYGYASKMLNIFRSLIRQLEKIDPRKMDHEEQLAFWINIHNALVMHAFLAYGLHQNHMKCTFSILKAAYDIGGDSVNAYDIQSSILGCQLHRPALGLRTLFSPTMKLKKRKDKHQYALRRPEPVAHFALCLGAYSDPAVRVYTAKSINEQLKVAKEEFIQSNVWVQKESKIILPKILYYYAKDASVELSTLVELVCDCMPESQQKVIQGCLRRRKLDKSVEWSPYKSSFKYLVHRDLAKQ